MLGNWLFHYFGIQGSGPWYAFWSGAGSDIGEVAILGGVIKLTQKRNCHTKGCWRFGVPVAGTPYLACHHHHPHHKGDKRNVSADEIARAAGSPGTLPPAPPDQS